MFESYENAKTLTVDLIYSTWKERIVALCLEKRIALYSPHTSWDSVRGGVTDWLARTLSNKEARVILPASGTETMSDVGGGRFCELDAPLPLAEAIERVKKHTGIKTVQVSLGVNSTLETPIKTYAVCAGSGSSVLKGVVADLYITGKRAINPIHAFGKDQSLLFHIQTGEMSHHDVLEAAHNNVNVILCNHSNSERGFLTHFKTTLEQLLNDPQIQINVSQTDADPLSTY